MSIKSIQTLDRILYGYPVLEVFISGFYIGVYDHAKSRVVSMYVGVLFFLLLVPRA